MNLKSYIMSLSNSELQDIATAAGTKPVYLKQIANGHRQPSPQLALKLSNVTNGLLRLTEMRPDVFPADYYQSFAPSEQK